MYEFGLAQPDLQVKLEDDGGCFGYADLGWPGLVGEFDGKVKYIAQDVLWKEKRPEGRVRRTGLGVGRRGWREAWHGEPLRQILYAAGVPPGRRSRMAPVGPGPSATTSTIHRLAQLTPSRLREAVTRRWR